MLVHILLFIIAIHLFSESTTYGARRLGTLKFNKIQYYMKFQF
jgi:hypothetical protein